MGKQYEGFDFAAKAYDDLSSSKHLLVVMNGNDIVDASSSTTDIIVGVLQDQASTGHGVSVRHTGHSQVKLGGVVAAGDLVGPDTSARAVTITSGSSTTVHVVGLCTAGGNTNEIGEVLLTPRSRAA